MHAKPRYTFRIEIGFCLPNAGKTVKWETKIWGKMCIISAELWLGPEKNKFQMQENLYLRNLKSELYCISIFPPCFVQFWWILTVALAVAVTYTFIQSYIHVYTFCFVLFIFQFMSITYVLQIAWLLMLCFLVIVTLIFTIFWSLCTNTDVQNNKKCIDFRQFGECFKIIHLKLVLSCRISYVKCIYFRFSIKYSYSSRAENYKYAGH